MSSTQHTAVTGNHSIDQTAALLLCNRGQVQKLLDTGLLAKDPAAHGNRVTSESANRLRGWQQRGPLTPGHGGVPERPVLGVHVGPQQPCQDAAGRVVRGFHVSPSPLWSARDLLDAWVGYWPISTENCDRLVGGVLLGDVAGFVPREMGAEVVGWHYDSAMRAVIFETRPLAPRVLSLYTERYVRPAQGPLWQWIV